MTRGYLELVTGPMFSGKTSYLLNWVSKLNDVLVVGHSSDNRYSSDEKVMTHGQRGFVCKKMDRLEKVVDTDIKFLAIDEAQFFPDLVDVCLKLVSAGTHVLVCGLVKSEKKWLGSMNQLFLHADKVVLLNSTCKLCKGDAMFTRRIDTSKPNGVGGSESYMSLCGKCYDMMETRDGDIKMRKLMDPFIEKMMRTVLPTRV